MAFGRGSARGRRPRTLGVGIKQKRLMPGAAYLEDQYGLSVLYLGVPLIVGAGGVEKIVEVTLTDEEKAMLKKSAESAQSVVDVVKKLS